MSAAAQLKLRTRHESNQGTFDSGVRDLAHGGSIGRWENKKLGGSRDGGKEDEQSQILKVMGVRKEIKRRRQKE